MSRSEDDESDSSWVKELYRRMVEAEQLVPKEQGMCLMQVPALC